MQRSPFKFFPSPSFSIPPPLNMKYELAPYKLYQCKIRLRESRNICMYTLCTISLFHSMPTLANGQDFLGILYNNEF